MFCVQPKSLHLLQNRAALMSGTLSEVCLTACEGTLKSPAGAVRSNGRSRLAGQTGPSSVWGRLSESFLLGEPSGVPLLLFFGQEWLYWLTGKGELIRMVVSLRQLVCSLAE